MRWWRHYYPFLNSEVRIWTDWDRHTLQPMTFYRSAMYHPLDTLAWNGVERIRELALSHERN